MAVTIFAAIFVCTVYMFVVAVQSAREVHTLADFFSFKPKHGVSDVIRTFEASNASFMTAFLALFLYSFSLGYATFWIPLGFCLGVVLYAVVFLPRQRAFVLAGQRFPELLEIRTGARRMRTVTSAFILLSFWLFYYAEFQGAVRFFGEAFKNYPSLNTAFPLLLVMGLAAYVWAGGFQSVVLTDRTQLRVIYVGTLTLLAIIAFRFAQPSPSHDMSRLDALPQFWSLPGFIAQTLIGFAFSQLLYYDNWLRLSLFFSTNRSDITVEQKEETFSRLRRLYIQSAIVLAVIYTPPIAVGLLEVARGTSDASPSTLVSFFATIHDTGILGRIAVFAIMLHLISALLSTADTYVISAIATVVEDLFRVPISSDTSGRRLESARLAAAVFAISVLPAAFTSWDFSELFTYIFYSANGFIGPLLALLWRFRMTGPTVVASIAAGFAIPIPFMLYESLQPALGYSGVIVAVVSLILTALGLITKSDAAGAGR